MAKGERIAAVTIDVHDGDRPEDLHAAATMLAAENIRATFFVPGALFGASHEMDDALAELPRLQHEVGSHAHHHDWSEVDALMRARDRSALSFLETARAKCEDFYGFQPKAFRSPVWCRLSGAALDELARLGYEVDSSATPQRVTLLSSRPFGRGWLLSRRSPHFIRPGLLEVPTTTAILPAGSTTFRLMRRRLSLLFVGLLLREAALFPRRVVVLQFDSSDLNLDAAPQYRKPLGLVDYLPRRNGGLTFRRHLLEYDPLAVATTAWKVLRLLSKTVTLSEVRTAWHVR